MKSFFFFGLLVHLTQLRYIEILNFERVLINDESSSKECIMWSSSLGKISVDEILINESSVLEDFYGPANLPTRVDTRTYKPTVF